MTGTTVLSITRMTSHRVAVAAAIGTANHVDTDLKVVSVSVPAYYG